MSKLRYIPILALTLLAFGCATASAQAVMIVGGSQQQACMSNNSAAAIAQLRSHRATLMRFGVSSAHAGQGLQCIRDVSRAGYKIYLTMGSYDSRWGPARTAAWFKRWLPVYAKAAPLYAVSIGNEQSVNPSDTGPRYRAVWNAVEPVVKRIAPHAKLVFAEAAPWDLKYVQAAWAAGGRRPAGVDAIGFHPYASKYGNGLWTLPAISAWAARQHVPLWASELTEWLDPPRYLKLALAHSPNVKMLVWYWMPKRSQLPRWADLNPPRWRWY